MKSNPFGSLLRVLVSFAALALLVYFLRHEFSKALEILRSGVEMPWFVAGAALYGAGISLLAVRLHIVFKVQGIHLRFREVYYLNLVGIFFNLFLPSAVGGDIAKAYYAYKQSGKKIAATTSVILDRLMGFVSLIIMAVVALAVFGKDVREPELNHVIYAFLAIMVLTALFFGSKRFASLFKFFHQVIPSEKWRTRLSDIYHAIYGYKKHKFSLVLLILLSFTGQCLFIFVHYAVARSLEAVIPVWNFFILVPISAIISMAPSLGGLGVREAGIIYLFKRLMPVERALALSLLLDILVYGASLLAGVIYLIRGGPKTKELMHEMESDLS